MKYCAGGSGAAFQSNWFDGEDTIQSSTLVSLPVKLRVSRSMDCNHFYVMLFSNASQKMYPSNAIAAFTVHLARPIDLGSNSKWEVGLAEIKFSPKKIGDLKNTIIVGETVSLMYCDLITFDSSLAKVLRTFKTPTVTGKYYFDPVFYVPVEKRTFHDIRIGVLDLKGAWK
jgi:hypothetical protein